ncbi:phosphotransferase family protein [Arthrobacter sp. zg-Y769]|uniref:phosphotransferase family protein n=1 Tax=Arthrobacter sp. zg-Y769 TaxID=2894191 RepID=UPI001E56AF36|nr:phosphotransferase [Arthrobacter sp. zg-Y769]MCC9205005.1 aminoglycoside phosphotransferase family protein [Arthrobacter sp. zg-Y769]
MGTIENRSLHALVDAAIEGLPPAAQAAPRSIVEIGSAHTVVLLDGTAAVRIGRDPATAAAMRKRQQLVDSIPESVGFILPRSLGPVVEVEGFSAVATRLIPGGPCPAGEGDPGQLQDLLGSVSSIATEPIEGLLTEPLVFCGGADWYRIQCEEVLPRLDQDVQERAADAVAALMNLERACDVFSHGDLAGHNVFWEGNRIVGVLDWDLASRSDRSTDLACIGAWNGWDKLPLIAGSADVRRAAVRRNTFRLQQVAFALVNGRPADEIGKAVARANTWLRERL